MPPTSGTAIELVGSAATSSVITEPCGATAPGEGDCRVTTPGGMPRRGMSTRSTTRPSDSNAVAASLYDAPTRVGTTTRSPPAWRAAGEAGVVVVVGAGGGGKSTTGVSLSAEDMKRCQIWAGHVPP